MEFWLLLLKWFVNCTLSKTYLNVKRLNVLTRCLENLLDINDKIILFIYHNIFVFNRDYNYVLCEFVHQIILLPFFHNFIGTCRIK